MMLTLTLIYCEMCVCMELNYNFHEFFEYYNVSKKIFFFISPYPYETPFITISIPSVNLIFFATYLEVPTQYELKSQKSANFGKQKTRFTSPFLKFLE